MIQEKLPPCVKVVHSRNRVALLSDSSGALCGEPHLDPDGRFGIIAGTARKVSGEGHGLPHPHHAVYRFSGPLSPIFERYTDNPNEAQAAFEHGKEWVLATAKRAGSLDNSPKPRR